MILTISSRREAFEIQRDRSEEVDARARVGQGGRANLGWRFATILRVLVEREHGLTTELSDSVR